MSRSMLHIIKADQLISLMRMYKEMDREFIFSRRCFVNAPKADPFLRPLNSSLFDWLITGNDSVTTSYNHSVLGTIEVVCVAK